MGGGVERKEEATPALSLVCLQCLVVGAGPCGLRAAVELALLGARVVLVEKRTKFSRHNVLHLWPFTIHDLRALGAKKFYGRFCTGTLDHISKNFMVTLEWVCLGLEEDQWETAGPDKGQSE